jgi:rod shape-determining protein MreD
MSRVPLIALFLFAWLAVFAQTQFPILTSWLGIPVNLLPALMVYSSLTHALPVVAAVAVVTGLSLDSLSSAPPGVSIVPLFAVGFTLHLRRHLILRDQTYAQFWLGLAAGLAAPVLTLFMLQLTGPEPITGPFLVWQFALTAALNGVACPALFSLFDALTRTFDYQPMTESSFRPDREIKRGRL